MDKLGIKCSFVNEKGELQPPILKSCPYKPEYASYKPYKIYMLSRGIQIYY